MQLRLCNSAADLDITQNQAVDEITKIFSWPLLQLLLERSKRDKNPVN